MPRSNTAHLREAGTELILEIFRLNGRLLAAGDALVADIGLSSARWQVLGAVALSPVPLPVAHLARNMGLARQSVQRLVDEMLDDGLVRYAPNPHHRRAKLVLLTARGDMTYRAAMDRRAPWAFELASGLTSQAILFTTSILRRIRGHIDNDVTPGSKTLRRLMNERSNHGGVGRNGRKGFDTGPA
jgi:DNA-binding MarR family transcriptional regulator